MIEILGRGEEDYRWGHEWEDMTSFKGDRFNISSWSTGIMLQILNYTPLAYIYIYTYVQKDIHAAIYAYYIYACVLHL